jgi:hypothetical protein
MSFIGDSWMQMAYNFEILKDSEGHPDSPFVDVIMDED